MFASFQHTQKLAAKSSLDDWHYEDPVSVFVDIFKYFNDRWKNVPPNIRSGLKEVQLLMLADSSSHTSKVNTARSFRRASRVLLARFSVALYPVSVLTRVENAILDSVICL